MLFFYDNVRPHMANRIQELLNSFKWVVYPHPPYSLDLEPTEFHLFPSMNLTSNTQSFDDDEELRVHVNEWLRLEAADFYDEGISKLVHCYNKCPNLLGDFVEK